jgi:Trk-type K+ transport system membrane component
MKLLPSRIKKWRQVYFFYIHFLYIVVFGLLMGTLIFLLEQSNTGVSFLDSIFTSYSALCITGLVTYDYNTFRLSSQVIIFICICLGGLTITTIPALLMKIYLERKRMFRKRQQLFAIENSDMELATVTPNENTDNNHNNNNNVKRNPNDKQSLMLSDQEKSRERSSSGTISNRAVFDMERPLVEESNTTIFSSSSSSATTTTTTTTGNNMHQLTKRSKFRKTIEQVLMYKPPPASDISYLAHLWLLITIVTCELIVLSIAFIALGICFTYGTEPLDRRNPWWVALYLTFSAFNNAGLTPFPDNLARFVSNVPVNLIVAFLIVFGNTCFPIMLRFVIWLNYLFSKRYKLVYKYMLDKHHHITVHLFPSLQTRVYGTITVLLLGTGTFLAYFTSKKAFQGYSLSNIFLISFFQTVSTRAAGFNTVDLNYFSIASLTFFLLMMRIKPQMVCDLKEGAYKITSREMVFREKMEKKKQKKRERKLNLYKTEKSESRYGDTMYKHAEIISRLLDYRIDNVEDDLIETIVRDPAMATQPKSLSIIWENTRETLRIYLERIWHHGTSLLKKNNMWLVLVILLICLAEEGRVHSDVNFTFFKIVFEVVSAFGNVGLSLGHPTVSVSFCGVFTPFSKMLILMTMILGRHRGFRGSMEDQDYLLEIQDLDEEKDRMLSSTTNRAAVNHMDVNSIAITETNSEQEEEMI